MIARVVSKIVDIIRTALFVGFAMVSLIFYPNSTATRFPKRPRKHKLFKKLNKSPHEYYEYVRGGVFSRLMGLKPKEEKMTILDTIEAQWEQIDPLNSPESLIRYFHGAGLLSVVDTIQETITLNRTNRPESSDESLEAQAVKRGFAEAYFSVKFVQ